MGLTRLPRFTRVSTIPRIRITERDRAIVRLIHRHRFLRSIHIVSFLNGSQQSILRRLQLLYHHGFLERPRAQIDYYRKGGSRGIVYGLGNKAKSVLKQDSGILTPKLSWGEKNRAVGSIFFEHALLVSDFMVGIELTCRQLLGVRYVCEENFPVLGNGNKPQFRWRVQIKGHLKLGIIPDRVFALDQNDSNRAFFFLEVDRGTMPVIRKSNAHSSMFRKFLAYEATWAKGLHHSLFGFHRFRVLTVTTSAARVKSLVEACAKLKSGHGLFLFCDRASLFQHGDILKVPWTNGRGEIETLLP
jgi:hypothetical protein